MTRHDYPRLGETVFTTKLPNGLTVMVTPKAGYSKSFAFFATNYGSVDTDFYLRGEKRSSPAGVAHYLEHKMFDTKDGNALQLLAQNGASPNAFTSYDITAYHFEATGHFYENLRVLLSFVSEGYFTEESVQKEQGIIAQEIRMYEDNPGSVVFNELMKLLYKNHPVKTPIAGTVESIAEITAQTLYDLHGAFYDPANMVLCCVGDIDPQKVVDTAMEILPHELGEAPVHDFGTEPPVCAGSRSSRAMEVSMPMFQIGFKNPNPITGAGYLRQNLTAEIAAELLMGASSPLYAKLYADGLINGGFYSGYESLAGVGFIVAGGESRDPDAVKTAIEEAAARVVSQGADGELYRRLRKAQFARRLRQYNSFDDICYLQATAFFNGESYESFTEAFDSIELSDVVAFIRDCVTPERTALSVIEPKQKQEA